MKKIFYYIFIIGLCFVGCGTEKKGTDSIKEDIAGEKVSETLPSLESPTTSINKPTEVPPEQNITKTPDNVLIEEDKENQNAAVHKVRERRVWNITEGVYYQGEYGYVRLYSGNEMAIRIISCQDNGQDNINIPSEIDGLPVISIGNGAFQNMEMTSITIPDTVIEIGERAFENCNSLTEIDIPDSVVSFGAQAFWGTVWLNFLKFTNDIITINNIVIDGTAVEGEVVLEDGIIGIADKAFANSKVIEIQIPKSVVDIGKDAFYNTPWLEKQQAESVLVIRNGILISGNGAKGKVVIPDGVVMIAGGAFRDALGLESIVIPDSVLHIEKQAFQACRNLLFISLSKNLQTIGEEVFYDCTKLKTMVDIESGNMTSVLPDTLTGIGDGAFSGCAALEEIVLPQNISLVGNRTFYECNSLKTVFLPENIFMIGRNAFYSCEKLKTINLQEGLMQIGSEAFFACEKLEDVYFPSSLAVIEAYAFAHCYSIKDVELQDNTTIIGEGAFMQCTSLQKLLFPKYVYIFFGSIFSGCTALEEVCLPDNTVSFLGTSLTDEWYGKSQCLNKFTIPSGVKTIEEGAFKNTNIAEIVIPDSVDTIMHEAFMNTKLTNISIPGSVVYIGEKAFMDTELVEVQLSEGIERISGMAFANTYIEKLTIPGSMTNLFSDYGSEGVFKNCQNLKKVIFSEGEGQLYLEEDTFAGCINLKKVLIYGNVRRIDKNVFEMVDGMQIYIGNSVQGIGADGIDYHDGYYVFHEDCFIDSWASEALILLMCPMESVAYQILVLNNPYEVRENWKKYDYYADIFAKNITYGGEFYFDLDFE